MPDNSATLKKITPWSLYNEYMLDKREMELNGEDTPTYQEWYKIWIKLPSKNNSHNIP